MQKDDRRRSSGVPQLIGGVALLVSIALVGCATPEPQHAADKPTVKRVRKKPEKRAKTLVSMPNLPSNASCTAARNAYNEAWALEDGSQKPDLSRGQFGSVLARSSYFDVCSVPERYEVSICAAVRNGEVLGATVRTSPRAPRIERCIDEGVRALSFPAHPRLDMTTTVFKPAS